MSDDKPPAGRWFMSFRRVQWIEGSCGARLTTDGAVLINQHPLEYCAGYNLPIPETTQRDVLIPLWWTQDIPAGFADEWEVES